MFFTMLITFMPTKPSLQLISSCLSEEFHTIGFAFQQMIATVLGIGGPVIFGAVVDLSCLLFTDKCIVYDSYHLALNITAFVVIVKAVAAFLYFLSYPSVKKSVTSDNER
jgi:hypothetical protein